MWLNKRKGTIHWFTKSLSKKLLYESLSYTYVNHQRLDKGLSYGKYETISAFTYP